MKKIQPVQEQLPALLEQTNNLVITNKIELDNTSDLLIRVKKLYKEIESHYDSIIKPIKKNIRNVEIEKKEKLSQLDSVVNILKTRISTYLSEEAIASAKEAEINNAHNLKQEEKDRKNTIKVLMKQGKVDEAMALKEAPMLVPVHIPDVPILSSGVYRTDILDYEIQDVDKIPNEYFKPRELDSKKIREAGFASKEIPGIKFFRKISIGVNA